MVVEWVSRLRTSWLRAGRWLTAALAASTVVVGLTALRPAPPPTMRVWVAAHDLSGGVPLSADELTLRTEDRSDVAADAVPATTPLAGRILAGPMRRGEQLTDVRLLSGALTVPAADGSSTGSVATVVRVGDGPAATSLVRAGEHIDVIAVSQDEDQLGASAHDSGAKPSGATTAVVARHLLVLATPATASAADSDGDGILVVAATPEQAASLASAATTATLSAVVAAG